MPASLVLSNNDCYDVQWVSGTVLVRVNGGAWITAFTLATESGLALTYLANGSICLTYQDASGILQKKYSSNRGGTWL